MRAVFLEKERESYTAYYRKINSEQISAKLRAKFGVEVCIPREYSLDAEKDDFVWLSREEGERNWGILMWADPYTDPNQLAPESLITRMDAMTRKYVPGSDPGSFMTHQPAMPHLSTVFNKGGNYCVQINGLWRMEGGFMGGPYVSVTTVDTRAGKIITGMGFVFYPNREKRRYIRQLEAILHTVKPASENK
jgi:hypothetical protein